MNGSSQKIRVIVLFGDIAGFTNFCESVTHDAVEYDPLMDKYDQLVDEVARSTGYHFDPTGDGFLFTVDLAPGHNCRKAIEVLRVFWRLLYRIQRLIHEHKRRSIGPDGFRMVVDCGYVKRSVLSDGRVVNRGKNINRAHKLLDTARNKGIVVTETFKQLIGDRQAKSAGISFESIQDRLWAVTMTK